MLSRNTRKLATVSLVACSAGLAAYYINLYQQQSKLKTLLFAPKPTDKQNPGNPYAVWNWNWDYRDPNALVTPKADDSYAETNRYNKELLKLQPTATRHIILVRHGEYMDAGFTDETHKLTERGRSQAQLTGKRLKEMNVDWEQVVVSTMTRAQETCDIIQRELGLDEKERENSEALCEGIPVIPEPSNLSNIAPSQVFRDSARIEYAFRRYFHRAKPSQKEDSYTLIIGHGNVLRYFVCRALQLPPEAWLRMYVNHASMTWLEIRPAGNVNIKYLGDTGYMPVEKLTYRMPRDST